MFSSVIFVVTRGRNILDAHKEENTEIKVRVQRLKLDSFSTKTGGNGGFQEPLY